MVDLKRLFLTRALSGLAFGALLAALTLCAYEVQAGRISALPQPDLTLAVDGADFSDLRVGITHDLMTERHAYWGHGTSVTTGGPRWRPGDHGTGPGDNCGNCQGNSGGGLGNGGPAVPEPGTFTLALLGLIGLVWAGRKRA